MAATDAVSTKDKVDEMLPAPRLAALGLQHVLVMYAGAVIEKGEVQQIFQDPQHPYTIGLMAAVPRMDTARGRLATIPGAVPPPWQAIPGCRFAGRCPLADDRCRKSPPPLRPITAGHEVACWKAPIEGARA